MSNQNTVMCGCGDIYPLDSYEAGFIGGKGHCQNCDAADTCQGDASGPLPMKQQYIIAALLLLGEDDEAFCAAAKIRLEPIKHLFTGEAVADAEARALLIEILDDVLAGRVQ